MTDTTVARFELVTTPERFGELAGDWQQLQQQAAGALQLFQDWTWVSEWWRHVGSHGNETLAIVIAWRDNAAKLIWPWVIQRRAGLRILRPGGGLLSCFDDALVAPDMDADDLLRQSWRFVLDAINGDAVELPAVHAQANIATLLQQVGGEPVATTRAPAIDLGRAGSFDAYLAGRSKKMRQNQRRSLKALGARGAVVAVADDRQLSVDEAIDLCLEFKSDWLSARGLPGKTIVTPPARAFLKSVANAYRQSPAGPQVCVSNLMLDGRPISIGIGYRFHGCHYEYLGGFDYRLEQFGPGRLRMEAGIRDCFARGMTHYNMLTPQTTFKRIWTHDGAHVDHYIIATSWKGRAYRDLFVRRLRPRLKRAWQALPPALRGRLTGLRLWG